MAMPKTKINRARARDRRASYYRKAPTFQATACKTCGAQKRAHRVCLECGTYTNAKGQTLQVLETED
jgi:large subunit ribosomal protein L32